MSEKSLIEWTDATWNPITGCTKVSPGCKNCYAETFAERFRGVKGHPYEQGFDLKLWPERLNLPLKWKNPRRIFVNSMSDLFHEGIPDEFVARVFVTMADAAISHHRGTRGHAFQILTKRAERMAALVPRIPDLAEGIPICYGPDPDAPPIRTGTTALRAAGWPLPNVWLGVSVETQQFADRRIPYLARTPAAVRFLSCEPLLGPLDLMPWLTDWSFNDPSRGETGKGAWGELKKAVDWVIVGGESGHGARPMHPDWAKKIRDDCQKANVPFFFKQWGGVQKKKTGRVLDGRTWDESPGVM